MKIANILGDFNHTQAFSFGVENPDAARPRNPNIALFITLHSIWYSSFKLSIADVLCETSSPRETTI